MKILPKTKWGWVRAGVIFAAAAAVLFWFYGMPECRVLCYSPEEGDVVFQSLPHVDLVDMIEGATGSPFSHCGLVIRDGGEWKVLESLGNVHVTPLYQWVQRGRMSGFAAYRLTENRRAKAPAFVAETKKFIGRYYDFRYDMDDEFIYCSELVWKGWKNATGEEMGRLVPLGELHWKPYVETITKYEQGPPPLDRRMITPKNLSEAPQLRPVYRSGI